MGHYFSEIGDENDVAWGCKKKTNADRIRSMSDVELAEFLEKVELGEFWADIPWLEWLKQEVE